MTTKREQRVEEILSESVAQLERMEKATKEADELLKNHNPLKTLEAEMAVEFFKWKDDRDKKSA